MNSYFFQKMSFWPIFETLYFEEPDSSEYNAIVMQMCSTCTLENCKKRHVNRHSSKDNHIYELRKTVIFTLKLLFF